jgi:hypothetical protein
LSRRPEVAATASDAAATSANSMPPSLSRATDTRSDGVPGLRPRRPGATLPS